MKKIIFLITVCLCVSIAKADEFPYAYYFSSKNSTVWICVSANRNNCPIYKIDFDNSGKISWGEEKNLTVYNKIANEHRDYINRLYPTTDYTQLITVYDKKNDLLWAEKRRGWLSFCKNDIWVNVYQIPDRTIGLTVLHSGNDGKVWVGGYAFVGYYHNEVFTEIFFIDEYDLQGTSIYTCEEDNCIEEELSEEDFDSYDDYVLAMYGPGYPSEICFCDGRKIGYINDSDGFVNFRSAPNISAPIIGIILDNVRVFYWDNENNRDWYRVEINDTTGYVHKSRIKSKKE